MFHHDIAFQLVGIEILFIVTGKHFFYYGGNDLWGNFEFNFDSGFFLFTIFFHMRFCIGFA